MQPLSINRQSDIQSIKQQPTEIKEGQIVYGKVMKIHGNQTAEVQIGNVKMTAVLVDVLTLRGDRIAAVTAFLGGEFVRGLGLPPHLPS